MSSIEEGSRRPAMKWIDVHISGGRTRVRCPNCRAFFTFDTRSLKDERRRWKCCPICQTRISGYTRPAPPRKLAATEAGQ